MVKKKGGERSRTQLVIESKKATGSFTCQVKNVGYMEEEEE